MRKNKRKPKKCALKAHLGSGGEHCKDLRGGNGGAGGRFSRRGILGDTHGEPLLGDC